MKVMPAFLLLLLHPLLCQAVDTTVRKPPPPVDPWGIALFVGVVAIALSWFIWKLRRSAKKGGEQIR